LAAEKNNSMATTLIQDGEGKIRNELEASKHQSTKPMGDIRMTLPTSYIQSVFVSLTAHLTALVQNLFFLYD